MSFSGSKKSKIIVYPETRLLSLPSKGNFFDPNVLEMKKIKKVRRRMTQRYGRHRFIAFLQGIYSCHWKRHQWVHLEDGTQPCCVTGDQIFFPFLVAALCMSLIFLYMWLEARNDYASFDEFVYQFTNSWFFWSFFLVITASIMFSYIILLMIIGICLLTYGQQLHLHWCNKIGVLLVLSIGIFGFLSINPVYEEKWRAAEVSLQVTVPYIHFFGICVMVLFSWPIAIYFAKLNKTALVLMKEEYNDQQEVPVESRKIMKIRANQFVSVISFLVVLLIIYTIPLGMQSPCLRENKTLGPKPTFIGHRGAPMLAPENTQMAFEKAIEHGATGLETDVTLSYDGVPFLMHDPTLRRTTNIHEILPDFTDMPAAMFTWQTLETLNSGQWFFKAKPYRNTAPLTKEEEKMAKNQSIMKLSNFLRLANKENKLVIFDLYRPPRKHPYRDTWIMKVLDVMMNEVGIKSHLVLWLPGQFRADVQMIAPDYIQVLGKKLPLPDLLRMGIKGLNLAYKDMNRNDVKEYEKYGIFTNIYVVNEPWLYSLAWCAGVHSVTTNTIQILKKIKRPYFLMTPNEYMKMWILLDFLSAFIITIVFFFHWWREKGWCELIKKKKSPVFPMSGVTNIEENIEEVQKQNKDNESQEEIQVSPSPSDKNTGDYWDSFLEMKSQNVKMTRSLSTESVIGSNDDDLQGNTFPTNISKDTGKGSDEEEVLEM
ncbi:glycerophosphodiester phosphodiesterase domain-containing protein 4 isoform X2 [Sarcophilus harrisii]|uniref:glycerophosphodiester phosphodiesterase domain-containing protein 4 isoform X2 n=1 Tax=Sarcophilus harrisii TaxID=9305 RepID=UPI001301D591|nr:glycerophosphodiester phosphodiesterase domain-containing protein 4 isoform X2 [Sarcophilus harrisii]